MAGGETDVFYRWHQFRREAAGVPENSDLRALRRLWAVSGVHDLYVFFFIPIFKWNRRFFVEMSCCGAVYELDPEVGKRLLRGEEVEITENDLTLRQDGNGNPWTGSDASHRHKVCPSCGFETDEDFSYCPKCGKPL